MCLPQAFQRFADDAAVHAFLREAGLRGEKLPNVNADHAVAAVRASTENVRAWRIVLL